MFSVYCSFGSCHGDFYRYTSLGSISDTSPNPSLRRTQDDGHATYQPAYMLTDDALERAGRTNHTS